MKRTLAGIPVWGWGLGAAAFAGALWWIKRGQSKTGSTTTKAAAPAFSSTQEVQDFQIFSQLTSAQQGSDLSFLSTILGLFAGGTSGTASGTTTATTGTTGSGTSTGTSTGGATGGSTGSTTPSSTTTPTTLPVTGLTTAASPGTVRRVTPDTPLTPSPAVTTPTTTVTPDAQIARAVATPPATSAVSKALAAPGSGGGTSVSTALGELVGNFH